MPPSAAAIATIQAATEGPPVSGTCCAPAKLEAEADAEAVAEAEPDAEAVADTDGGEEPKRASSIASCTWVFS